MTESRNDSGDRASPVAVDRRRVLLGGSVLALTSALGGATTPALAQTQQQSATPPSSGKPNILIIWGDDVGIWNLSCYHRGMMGGSTPNIDRIAKRGMIFMDHYAQASCTAGRAAFITGQYPIRTGLTTVGLPGSPLGLQKEDPTIAELLKAQGYATGQFGKNHLGDRDEHLPTAHGFDEFFGVLYHLNEGQYSETYDYPKGDAFKKKFGGRGVIHSWAAKAGGQQRIEDTGEFGIERQRTLDREIMKESMRFITDAAKSNQPFFVWHNSIRTHIHSHLSKEYQGKTGLGLYADAMADLDDQVGELLKLLDELGVTENTLLMFSTDNGAAVNSWPDGGNTPFRGEKGTTWEGGFRVPMVVSWPGHVPEGSVTGEFMTMEDWLPTLLAVAGQSDVKTKLLSGGQYGDKSFKVHLDGYNQMDLITGKGPSKRKEFFYFAETSLQAMRYASYKFHYITQDKWFNGTKTKLNTPLTIDLRADPFEKFTQARGFDEWQEDHAYLLGPSTEVIQTFLKSLQDYPPRIRGTNFDINEMMQSMSASQGSR